jgi:alpha-galactosidase
MKAPLLVGCDIRNIPEATMDILTNPDAIAVNQDAAGVQGHKVRTDKDLEIWAGPLKDGSMAAILLNRGTVKDEVTITSADLGWEDSDEFMVYDIWQHRNVGVFSGKFSATVEAHGVMFGRFTKQAEISDNSIDF